MKKLHQFVLLFITSFAFSQTFVPDESFSADGVLTLGSYLGNYNKFLSVKEINGSYYAATNTTVFKVSTDGTTQTQFSGATAPAGESPTFFNVKYEGDYIYMLGTGTASGNTRNILILKLDLDLNPAAGFGTNGIVSMDFGDSEEITDFVFDEDGNMYCSGTRKGTLNWTESKIILFKLNPNTGALITTFDPAGYKNYVHTVSGAKSEKGYIQKYNGNYILAGRSYSPASNFVAIKIDTNGNVVTDFGTNGYKTNPINYSFAAELPIIQDIKIIGENLYMAFDYQPGFATMRQSCIYRLDTNTVTILNQECSSMSIYDDGIYFAVNALYMQSQPFIISKKTLSGATDTTFNSTGSFSFSLTNYNAAHALLKDLTGKIVLVGAGDSNVNGLKDLKMVRLNPIELSVHPNNPDRFSVYPNPFSTSVTIDSAEKVSAVEVYDIAGRKIALPSLEYNGNSATIDLSGIKQKGLYVLKIKADNKTVVKKITRN